jgi:hypothetical protein
VIVADNAKNSFEAMQQAFDQAAALKPHAVSEYHLRVAGLAIHMRTVGISLAAEMTPPWAPFESPEGAQKPDLTIDIWDQDETGVAGTPAGRDEDQTRYSVLSAHSDDRYIAEERQGRMIWLDREECRIVGFTGPADRLNIDERGRPFQRMLAILLNDKGVQPVHAGLVAWQDQGMLITGMSGAGKSTSSIACLNAGFGYLGDDTVGLEANSDGTFTGHGMYASCLVTPDHLKRFPAFAPHQHAANRSHEDKSVIYLSELFPGQMKIDVPIKAIVLPRVVGTGENTFRPASKGEALRALAPSSVIMFVAGPTARSIDKLVALIEAVPCYALELGRDVNGIPDTIREIAATVAQS